MFTRSGLLFFGLWLSIYQGWAQSDSVEYNDRDVNLAIEDFITTAEVEEQVDYTYLTDALEDLQTNPLDLNTASREELLIIPGMNELLVTQLQDYLISFGNLTSIFELQAVPGFDQNVIRQIQPYVYIKTISTRDISQNARQTSGPPLGEAIKDLDYELIQRFVWVPERQRGYTDPDTTFQDITNEEGVVIGQDTSLSTRYAGSPLRSYTRLRARYGKNVSVALVGEKDPGEVFEWNPDQNLYGYDFLAGHVAIGGYGPIKQLVVGDYTAQFGQGLVLSRGLGFGKGASVINSVKAARSGLNPYTSVNENQYQRGLATTLEFGKWQITGFYSRLNVDASISQLDTLDDEVLQATGLQTSGLHRTRSELANRKAVLETFYGGRAQYQSNNLTIGTNHYIQQFGSELNPTLNSYNQFNFRGDINYVNGIDFDWVVQNFNFFGEFARSRSGGLAGTVGFMSSLSPTVDLSLLARHFDIDFHNNKGYVFAERPTALQNETGLYLGLRIAPNPKWTLNTYVDQFYFPYNRFQAGFATQGWEFLTQLEYKPERNTLIYARFRSDNKQTNGDEIPGQKLDYIVPTQKNTARLHFQTKLGREIDYRARIEYAWYTEGERPTETGWLLYQDLVWKFNFNFRLTGRFAIFDVPSFDARIYAYENDVLGFFSIPPYFNQGTRYYLIANWKATRQLEFWVRVAQTRLHNACTIQRPAFAQASNGQSYEVCSFGSGLEEINGNRRSELKFQVRYKF